MLLLRLAARLLFVLNVQICLYQCRAPWFLPALARPMRAGSVQHSHAGLSTAV